MEAFLTLCSVLDRLAVWQTCLEIFSNAAFLAGVFFLFVLYLCLLGSTQHIDSYSSGMKTNKNNLP